ncbi:MFS transporter [Mycobacteroides saopaulense]|uniref:MFS transporter n=1 Tax=Mycobacteroides saopaulense TaxID=1578165 RepID=A0ABX3BZ12_9MYCO|nr:MFS transporter [Mycobacteroides saopaulense]OHT87130.1 MFS transporter [Mycobacteroides saopaulense]OHU08989.1 MFS transporter [Mycobacteroides saopaulense]
MSHITITIDGDTLMDADPGSWRSTPPDIEALKLKSGGQPWGIALMGAVAEAATLSMANLPATDTTIVVTTRDNGWTLDVEKS